MNQQRLSLKTAVLPISLYASRSLAKAQHGAESGKPQKRPYFSLRLTRLLSLPERNVEAVIRMFKGMAETAVLPDTLHDNHSLAKVRHGAESGKGQKRPYFSLRLTRLLSLGERKVEAVTSNSKGMAETAVLPDTLHASRSLAKARHGGESGKGQKRPYFPLRLTRLLSLAERKVEAVTSISKGMAETAVLPVALHASRSVAKARHGAESGKGQKRPYFSLQLTRLLSLGGRKVEAVTSISKGMVETAVLPVTLYASRSVAKAQHGAESGKGEKRPFITFITKVDASFNNALG